MIAVTACELQLKLKMPRRCVSHSLCLFRCISCILNWVTFARPWSSCTAAAAFWSIEWTKLDHTGQSKQLNLGCFCFWCKLMLGNVLKARPLQRPLLWFWQHPDIRGYCEATHHPLVSKWKLNLRKLKVLIIILFVLEITPSHNRENTRCNFNKPKKKSPIDLF